MGWFSSSSSNSNSNSSKKKKQPQKSTSWNVCDPPTAYAPSRRPAPPPPQPQHYSSPQYSSPPPLQHYPSSPPPPPRQYPATRPYPHHLYGNPHASYSQPVLLPPSAPARWPSQQQQQQQQPARPQPPRTNDSRVGMSRWADSVMHIADSAVRDVYDDVSARLDDVMTRIDRETMSSTEANLLLCYGDDEPEPQVIAAAAERALTRIGRGGAGGGQQQPSRSKASRFAKVELYANSKLPLDMPPLALYMPTWPLLCLAAQYSSQVYAPDAQGHDEETYAASDWRAGTKAMCIKSVPMDHAAAIVFAIRGTSSFMDWAVNLSTELSSPENFLDDAGNLCHAGFLSVARNMVRPVAARLRRLLQEAPGRAAYSLLITGHSAGGAIAALLYMHMLATTPGTESELNVLAGCFKRIHCVTFGAPPISLLPLQKPSASSHRLRKCLFLAFVNEGDPVARADKAYVMSLLDLMTKPAPERQELPDRAGPGDSKRQQRWRSDGAPSLPRRRYEQVHWPVPDCKLSNAGRIVVLRAGDPMTATAAAAAGRERTLEERLAEGTRAVTCVEADLRGVIWGDPVAHMMGLYAGRIETLAVAAVMGKS
ncbi:hypothetical protein MY3296_007875 [Beauveria thailandica]